MLLFLDTEFTDFIDIELISIGIVSEDGLHTFYAERNDFRRESASDFVRTAVMPHLGQRPRDSLCREELGHRLYGWIHGLPERVFIACDSAHDRDLLWDAMYQGRPSNLDPKVVELASLTTVVRFNEAVYRYHLETGAPRHHALHDARALRVGWMALNQSINS